MFLKILKNLLGRRVAANEAGLAGKGSDFLAGKFAASACRNEIRNFVQTNTAPELAKQQLVEQAAAIGWAATELSKLSAYCDFYRGHAWDAYHRIITESLHETDFELMMTAAVYCYQFDRYSEGYQLLKGFSGKLIPVTERIEYFSYIGYLAVAATGDFAAACEYFDEILLADEPKISPLFAVNAYPIYFEAGQHERVALLRQVMAGHLSDDPEAQFALGTVELAKGYYPEGFRLCEARYRMPGIEVSFNTHLLKRPRWNGQSLHGKTLLLHGEQGYGDLIQMARYFSRILDFGGRLLVDTRSEIIPLLQHNFPNINFVVSDNKKEINTPYDYWLGIMSLPFVFDTTRYSVPLKSGYLGAPEDALNYWQGRVGELSSAKIKVGIAWSGNSSHRADKRRSIPTGLLYTMLPRAKFDFFPLQTNVSFGHPGNLIDIEGELLTFSDTAALIAHMDCVITVDTSIVHLAGAMGVPTMLLLPYRYEWRWGLQGESNDWYDSVKVLRQTQHGRWDELLIDAFARLETIE